MSRTLTAEDLTAIKMICRRIILELREDKQPGPRPEHTPTIDFVELLAVSRMAHAKGRPKDIQKYLDMVKR